MSTYHDLAEGEPFTTPARTLDDAVVRTLVEAGGYTHPLFTDPEFAKSSAFGRTPLPGEATLLIMGGLVEQSGRFDESVIALIELNAVRFVAPAFAGDTLRVEVEVLAKEPRPDGKRGTLVMAWRCLNNRDETVCEAVARMLFRI